MSYWENVLSNQPGGSLQGSRYDTKQACEAVQAATGSVVFPEQCQYREEAGIIVEGAEPVKEPIPASFYESFYESQVPATPTYDEHQDKASQVYKSKCPKYIQDYDCDAGDIDVGQVPDYSIPSVLGIIPERRMCVCKESNLAPMAKKYQDDSIEGMKKKEKGGIMDTLGTLDKLMEMLPILLASAIIIAVLGVFKK